MAKITIELTEEQITKIIESRQPKNKNLSFSIIGASRELGVSESTMHRLIKNGTIKTNKLGPSPRVSIEEVEKYKSLT
jgi:excisionase family DNA binding protein